MPTLDWLNRVQAMRVADAVPYRLLEPVASHGGSLARIPLQNGYR